MFTSLNRGFSVEAKNIYAPTFNAPLKVSGVLSKGNGSPAFTRATLASVTNSEGFIEYIKSGELRFSGYRRVENLVATTSEDWTNGAWTKTIGTVTATTLTATGANQTVLQTYTGTGDFRLRVDMYRLLGTGNIDLTLNGGSTWTTVTLTGNTQTFSILGTGITNPQFGIRIAANGDSIYASKVQLSNTIGHANQNPHEYVSVGVLSSPFHGAFVDGVKYFSTVNATTVSSNVVTDSVGSNISSATTQGVLSEPSKLTSYTYSEVLDNTSGGWILSSGVDSVTLNSAVSPTGATTANLMLNKASPGLGYIYKGLSFTNGTNYIITIYAKPITGTSISIRSFTQAGNADFTLTGAGSTSNVTGIATSASIKAIGSGWYRCTAKLQANATGTNNVSPAYLNGASASIYVWGAQAGPAPYEMTYIKTTTTSYTRNADVLSYTTTNNINYTQGSVTFTYIPLHSPSGTIDFIGTYVDASNYTAILHNATNLIFRKRISGTNYDATVANSFVDGSTYKVAVSWGPQGTQIALNGTVGSGHANAASLQLSSSIQVGADGNSGGQPSSSITDLKIYRNRFGSGQLAKLSA